MRKKRVKFFINYFFLVKGKEKDAKKEPAAKSAVKGKDEKKGKIKNDKNKNTENDKILGESNFEELGFVDKGDNNAEEKPDVKELDSEAKNYVLDYVNKFVG